jgi:hypothetical protein
VTDEVWKTVAKTKRQVKVDPASITEHRQMVWNVVISERKGYFL